MFQALGALGILMMIGIISFCLYQAFKDFKREKK